MAVVTRYYCQTCNTDLGADGTTVLSHLSSNPTHTVGDTIYDDSETIATVQGITRVYNDELYSWDESRQKWLSVNRAQASWGTPSANQNNVYLRLWGSMTPLNADMGFRLTSNATLTKVRANRRTVTSSTTFTVRVYSSTIYATYTLSAGAYENYNDGYNVDIPAGATLSVYLSGTSSSSYPQFWIEIARRIS